MHTAAPGPYAGCMDATGRPPTIRLFGSLLVESGARRLGPRDFGGVKPKQVLEILLTARGRGVPKDRIAELLWARDLPQNVTGALATYVSVLRRSLRGCAPEGRELVVTETQAYRFAVEHAETDLDRFDELVDRAATAPTSTQRRLLHEALALVRGDVLEDEPYADWAEDARGAYRARVLAVRMDAAEAALAERDLDAGLRHAQASISIDRFSERAHRLAMLALFAQGRQHEAVAVYHRLRRLLDEDLGLDPMPETRALHTSVLRHEDLEALLPRPTGRSIDVVPAGGAPLRLLGRADEVTALERLVRRTLERSFSLALIEGEAGVGKSRVLDEVAAALAPARVGRATCSQLERHLPYVPLAAAVREALGSIPDDRGARCLGQILPELGRQEPECTNPEVDALEALIELIQAHAPLVLMIDDLQWADPATLGAIAYLQRRCAGLPLAIIGSARTEELGPNHPVRRLAPTLRIELGPLTPCDLDPLGMPGLHTRTGGNPRFVAAAVREGGTANLEETLAGALLARCRAEGGAAHAILACASVLAEPFEPDVVARMLDLDPAKLSEEMERLCDRRLLSVAGLGFRFRYEIYRDILRRSISPARRRILEDRAALSDLMPA
jgi:DNA-binding SARP family transcriptional activator